MYISIKVEDGGYIIERIASPLGGRVEIRRWVRPTIEATLDLIKELMTDMPAGVVDALLAGESEVQEEEVQDENRT